MDEQPSNPDINTFKMLASNLYDCFFRTNRGHLNFIQIKKSLSWLGVFIGFKSDSQN